MFDRALSDLPESRKYIAEGAELAIAAYERTLLSSAAPFQRWLRNDESAMTEAQKEGALLFFGRSKCYTCHYGPSLAAMEFHASGFGDFDVSKGANFSPDNPAM